MEAGHTAFLLSSLAFALYITCPRMTAMIATQAKLTGINPFLVILTGSLLGVPMFYLLYLILKHIGVGAAVIAAALLDAGAALLMGGLDLKAGIELAIITVFVYIGIRVAPIAAKLLTT